MKKVLLSVAWIIGLLSAMPAWSFFSSCDGASKRPKPDWVVKLGSYSLPDFHVGVGSAELLDKSKDKQAEASGSAARRQLVEGIETVIISENKQSTRVSQKEVQVDAQSRVEVRAEEVLRDLQTKAIWIDPDSCVYYTLVVVSKASVAQAKREKIMKQRIEKFKVLLAEGEDRNKNRDLKLRRKYLEDAQSLLTETDFSLLQDEVKKEVYLNRLSAALAQAHKEASQVKGRMALFALNPEGKISSDVIGKMIDQLRASDGTAERLLGDCQTEQDCIQLASERGFSKLALLKASSQIGMTQMGAYKGTLTITRTVFDIENHKKQGLHTVSAQVIGWSNEELDWLSAVDKAMQDLK